jgi:hypothetical protein
MAAIGFGGANEDNQASVFRHYTRPPEMGTLETVLSQYLAVCERELANGADSPFFADQDNIKRIFSRLRDKIHTSKGLLSAEQIREMLKTGQAPAEFYEV